MEVVQPRYPGTEARAGKFPGPSLIPALNAIQRRRGWLPRDELVTLSREVRRPLYEIEGLISFYPHFRTTEPKTVQVAVCHDLTCWLHGSDERIAEAKARYGDDVEVELVEVSCLGRWDIAPAAAVDERPLAYADAAEAVEAARGGSHSETDAKRGGEPRPNDPYAAGEERYRVLRRALAGDLGGDAIVATLKDSGLRGMGGAGFPTGQKWEIVAAQQPTPKYTVCNADESEPGTFKDRQILAEQPHLVLEGMLLGMLVTGCEEGWVFIRHEYGPEEDVVRAEIETLRSQGLLGDDVLGSGRRLQVEIFTSPGGYILGEESALLECMEGHRGEPRNKPPFPGLYGLWGKPTLMNSVETFADVPIILERGAQWWKEQGVNGATGLKFFAVKTVAEALASFRAARRTVVEAVALDAAAGRVPAAPVRAPHDLPGFARSTVDGYAVRAADTFGASEGLPTYLEVAGAVAMGRAPDVAVAPGGAVAIPTGGVLPPRADAVVMVEHTQEAIPGTIEVVRPAAPGDGTVRADEDAAAGAELVPARRPLPPQDPRLLAAAGVPQPE